MVSSVPSELLSYEFSGSYASLYATLGLYAISFPGLISLIKRATKIAYVQKDYIFADGRAMREVAGEVMAYMTANNYEVSEPGETITFKGKIEASKSQAFSLAFFTFVGLASLALVLSIQVPAIGAYWWLMVLVSPYSGIYYWENAATESDFKVKLEAVSDDESQLRLVVRGGKEDVERMERVMELRQEGMVKVRGVFEGTFK